MTHLNKSMVEFVMSEKITNLCESDTEVISKVIKYAKFLSEPLALWMVVPCSEDGEVLEEPMSYKRYRNSSGTMAGSDILLCEQYQQAKERCYFENFIIIEDICKGCAKITNGKTTIEFTIRGLIKINDVRIENRTVESLIPYNLKLSQTIKNKGLEYIRTLETFEVWGNHYFPYPDVLNDLKDDYDSKTEYFGPSDQGSAKTVFTKKEPEEIIRQRLQQKIDNFATANGIKITN